MKHSRNIILRRLIFSALIVSAFVLQFTYIPYLHLPFPVFILTGLCVSVAMFEREYSGAFFGFLSGVLWDMASPLPDGILALGFCLFAFVAGLLTRYLLRNTLLSAFVLTFIISIIFACASVLYTGFSSGYEIIRDITVGTYLPAVILSVILTLPSYFIVRKISVVFRNDKTV